MYPHVPSDNKPDDGTTAALISCRIEDIEAEERISDLEDKMVEITTTEKSDAEGKRYEVRMRERERERERPERVCVCV